MTGERSVVREVSWRDLLPWLVLFRAFGVAKSAPAVLLGTLGAILTPVGWQLGAALFLEGAEVPAGMEAQAPPPHDLVWPFLGTHVPPPNRGAVPGSLWDVLRSEPDAIQPIFWRFVDPVRRFFSGDLSLTLAAYHAFGFLWMLIVWAFFGGAITRIAGVRLGREEQIGLVEACRHAARRLGAYIGSPLFPLTGVVLLTIPLVLLGWLMRWDGGVLAAGIVWLLVLLGGLMLAILLLGLLFGWPLMWATVSCEQNGDAFEAFSRSFSYTYQRPLHYLFYAVLAVLLGGLVWLLVYQFVEAVIGLAGWAVALGAGPARWEEVAALGREPAAGFGVARAGALLIAGFSGLTRSVSSGLAYSFFWCSATAIYLLLRRDVDQTEFDEVFVEHEDLDYQLPAIGSEAASAQASPDETSSPDAASR